MILLELKALSTNETITLIAALLSGCISTWTAFKVLSIQRSDSKSLFCIELKRQFDSEEMFKCRFNSWNKLKAGKYSSYKSLDQLLKSSNWEHELSYVIHFFESLEYYCVKEMVDVELAKNLFARPYRIWYNGLIKKLDSTESDTDYQLWLQALNQLGRRFSI